MDLWKDYDQPKSKMKWPYSTKIAYEIALVLL